MLNTNAPDPNAPLWLLVLLSVAAVLTVVDKFLSIIAKRTKNTTDDKIEGYLSRFLAWIKKFSPLSVLAAVALAAVAAVSLACGPKSIETLRSLGACSAKAAVDDVVPAAKSILENGGDNWRDELKALGVAYGEDVLACAVGQAGQLLAAKAGGDTNAAQGAARARTWLDEQGYHASLDRTGDGFAVNGTPPSDGSVSIVALTAASSGLGSGERPISDVQLCESPDEMPIEVCGRNITGAMTYDGCHWECVSSGVLLTSDPPQ